MNRKYQTAHSGAKKESGDTMRKKCHSCLCRTCLDACGKCAECKEKISCCDNYNGCEQMSIFGTPQEQPYHGTPRHSLKHYRLTNERVKELEKLIQSGRYTSLASQAAHRADKDAAGYILLSIEQNLSYDALEKLWARGKIDRIPCSRTGFYYTKKYFFHLMDMEMRKIGK